MSQREASKRNTTSKQANKLDRRWDVPTGEAKRWKDDKDSRSRRRSRITRSAAYSVVASRLYCRLYLYLYWYWYVLVELGANRAGTATLEKEIKNGRAIACIVTVKGQTLSIAGLLAPKRQRRDACCQDWLRWWFTVLCRWTRQSEWVVWGKQKFLSWYHVKLIYSRGKSYEVAVSSLCLCSVCVSK